MRSPHRIVQDTYPEPSVFWIPAFAGMTNRSISGISNWETMLYKSRSIKRKIKLFLLSFVTILFCYFLFGDRLLLEDGTEIYGVIKSRENGIVSVDTGIELMKIDEKEIKRIEPGKDKEEEEKSGDTYFNNGDFRNALEYYEKAFLKNSKSRSLLNKILITKKKIEASLTIIDEKESVSDILKRGKELEDKVRKEDARKLLLKAIEKFPDAEELYIELAKIYESENLEDYYKIIDILVNKWSEKYYSTYVDNLLKHFKNKIYYYNQVKDYPKAEEFLFKSIPFSPSLTEPLSYEDYKARQFDEVEKAALSISYSSVSPFLNLRDFLLQKYYAKIEKAFYDDTKRYYGSCAPVVFDHLRTQLRSFINSRDFENALDVMKRLVAISSDIQNLNTMENYLDYKDDKSYQLSMINKWALENKEMDIMGLASKELLTINPEDKKGWENVTEFIESSVNLIKEEYAKGESLELISIQYKELEKFKDLIKDNKSLYDNIDKINRMIQGEREAEKYLKEAQKAFDEKKYQEAKSSCDFILTNLGTTRTAEIARELEIKCDREIGYMKLVNDIKNSLDAGDYYTANDSVSKVENDFKNAIQYNAEEVKRLRYKALDNIFKDQLSQAQTKVSKGDYLGASDLLTELLFKYSLWYEKPYWDAERFLSQCRENLPEKHKGKMQGIIKKKLDSQYYPFKGVYVYIVNGIIEEPLTDVSKIIKGRGYVDKDVTNRRGEYEIQDLPIGDYSVIFCPKDKSNQAKIVREKIIGDKTVTLDQNLTEF